MKDKIKLTNKEIKELLGAKSFDFPKYSTQLMNLANQNAQGTRPAVVGQMSELISGIFRKINRGVGRMVSHQTS